jgi:hypothetical protein
MVTFFAVALGIVAILTLICLAAPVRLRLTLNDKKRSLALSWLVMDVEGNLREKVFRLELFHQRIITGKFKKDGKAVKKTKKKKFKAEVEVDQGEKKKSKLRPLDLWIKKELVVQVIRIAFRFILDLLRAIRWDELSLEVDVATPDPALTGALYGQLCALKHSAHYLLPNARVRVQPDFVNQLPRGSAETAFSVRPVNVVVSASKMFFALPKIQIMKALIQIKRR